MIALADLPRITGALESIAMGQCGSDLLTDTGEYAGDWAVVTAIADATFTTLVSLTTTTNNTYESGGENIGAGLGTLKAGCSVYGRFTTITLATGKVIAYRTGEE